MIWRFLKQDIWHVDLNSLPKWKAYLYRLLRVILLVSQGFTKSQIQQGAASLTYYTLLAIVPVIALIIGISRGFELEKTFETWLTTQFTEQQEIIKKIFEFANLSLEKTNQGLIAGIGIALFLWAALKILLYVEFVMNKIWEVRSGRSIARRFSDFLALVFLCPIVILIASGLSVYLSATILTMRKHGVFLTPVLAPIFDLIPYIITALLLTFLYIFMPNTRVRFLPAFIAGVVTTCLYALVQWVYLTFQLGVSKYNAIYGTFAAIPLFLIWAHLSWVIILMGAKTAFAIQNIDAYEFISEDVPISNRSRMLLTLRIAHMVVKKFCDGQPPPSAVEISIRLSIPLALTGTLIYELVNAGIFSEVKREKDEEECYQPARNVDQLTIKQVIDMINERGGEIPLPSSRELSLILNSLEKFGAAIESSDANLRLKDI